MPDVERPKNNYDIWREKAVTEMQAAFGNEVIGWFNTFESDLRFVEPPMGKLTFL